MKYPVGPKTRKEAAATQPGRLAAILNKILYNGDFRQVKISDHCKEVRHWSTTDTVYMGDISLPEGVDYIEQGRNSVCPEDVLRAIRDYLEFRSFEEVIP